MGLPLGRFIRQLPVQAKKQQNWAGTGKVDRNQCSHGRFCPAFSPPHCPGLSSLQIKYLFSEFDQKPLINATSFIHAFIFISFDSGGIDIPSVLPSDSCVFYVSQGHKQG